jgi:hypothetical protein
MQTDNEYDYPPGLSRRVAARALDALVLFGVSVGLGQLMGFGYDWLGLTALLVLAYFSVFEVSGLVALLDPDVVLRSDGGEADGHRSFVLRGPLKVGRSAFAGASLPSTTVPPTLVNGAAGAIVLKQDRPFAVMAFTIANGKTLEIDCVLDPKRLEALAFGGLARDTHA